eukprot:5591308-Pyramimonas_sp.AAC.1
MGRAWTSATRPAVAGWRVVLHDSDRCYVGAIFRAVPPDCGTLGAAREGEDYATLMCAENVLGQLTGRADCRSALSCCQSPKLSTSECNPRAHLWRRVHVREDIRARPIEQHVKAHTSAASVERGLISPLDRDGNNAADGFAKCVAAYASAAVCDLELVEGCRSFAKLAA